MTEITLDDFARPVSAEPDEIALAAVRLIVATAGEHGAALEVGTGETFGGEIVALIDQIFETPRMRPN